MDLFNRFKRYTNNHGFEIFLAVWILQICVINAGRDCSTGRDKRADTPLCQLVDFASPNSDDDLGVENQAYSSILSSKATIKLYPTRVERVKSLKRFDELPYPLPVGASLYFFTVALVFFSWYIRRLVWSALHKMADRIELFPETNKFPSVKLYSLQESKREARLRREARNTWAWMANKYLLMPNHPRVNTDVFKTTWSDFDIPKDVWGIVRAIMKVNALYNRAKGRIGEGNPINFHKAGANKPDGDFEGNKEHLKGKLEELKKEMDPGYETLPKTVQPSEKKFNRKSAKKVGSVKSALPLTTHISVPKDPSHLEASVTSEHPDPLPPSEDPPHHIIHETTSHKKIHKEPSHSSKTHHKHHSHTAIHHKDAEEHPAVHHAHHKKTKKHHLHHHVEHEPQEVEHDIEEVQSTEQEPDNSVEVLKPIPPGPSIPSLIVMPDSEEEFETWAEKNKDLAKKPHEKK